MKTKIILLAIVIGVFTVSNMNAQEIDKTENKTENLEKEIYSCSMHPEIKMMEPGSCPKCGMELTKVDTEKDMYSCSMHSDVIKDEPGNCPKCSMGLIKMDMESKNMNNDMKNAYACPMKCEGEKNYMKDGSCPVCNMKLKEIKRTKTHNKEHRH